MTTYNLLRLLLLVLCGLLVVIGGLLPRAFKKQQSLPGKCFIFGVGAVSGVLLTVTGWLLTTSQENQNLYYLSLGIGYAFSLPTALYLLISKSSKNGELRSKTALATSRQTLNQWRQELLKIIETDVNVRLSNSRGDRQLIPLLSENIIEVFNRDNTAGRLLILGAPGSGKTTTLLELARDLIQCAQQQSTHPIPVLFELSDWKDDKQGIADWLASDLKFRHNIPETITRKWIKTGQLLPLMDGLDQLGLTRQRLCIQKINEFLQVRSGQSPLVVCCRQEEYTEGKVIIDKLREVVYLQPLSEEQIEDYLKQVGYGHLCLSLKDDPDGLLELAKIPLLLKLIPVAYPEKLKQPETGFNDPTKRQEYQEKCRQELIDTYIKRCLEKYHDHPNYSKQETKRWLSWLAKRLKEQQQTEFFIEYMQPDLLKNFSKKWLYRLAGALMTAIVSGLIGWLILGQFVIFSFSVVGALLFLLNKKIEPVQPLKFSWLKASFGLIVGLILGVFMGKIVLKVGGVLIVLFSGITGSLYFGIDGEKIKSNNQPNQGIKESAKNVVRMSLMNLPAGLLVFAWMRLPDGPMGPVFGPIKVLIIVLGVVLFLGISSGGLPVIQHFVLRLMLWGSRVIPWNYAHFLGYAAEHGLIEQVGGRYRFINNLLRDRFAQMLDG